MFGHVLGLALAIGFLSVILFGMLSTAADSLTLEQVPSFRGTTMSLNSAAMFMGGTLGAVVGGVVLLHFDYEGIELALGALLLVARPYLLSLDR